VLFNKAALLAELGRYAAALESLEAGLAVRPDDPSALANKGIVLSELGRHEDALKALNRTFEVRPSDADVLTNGKRIGQTGKARRGRGGFRCRPRD
jgi:Flp pilus assembly protein TadD